MKPEPPSVTDVVYHLEWRGNQRRRQDAPKQPSKAALDWRVVALELEHLIDTCADISKVSGYVLSKHGHFCWLGAGNTYEIPTSNGLEERQSVLTAQASWPDGWLARRDAVFFFDERLQVQSYLLSHPSMIDKKAMLLPIRLGGPEID